MCSAAPNGQSNNHVTGCTSISIQGETELSFRLIPSLTQSHTKPHTKTVREEVI